MAASGGFVGLASGDVDAINHAPIVAFQAVSLGCFGGVVVIVVFAATASKNKPKLEHIKRGEN